MLPFLLMLELILAISICCPSKYLLNIALLADISDLVQLRVQLLIAIFNVFTGHQASSFE